MTRTSIPRRANSSAAVRPGANDKNVVENFLLEASVAIKLRPSRSRPLLFTFMRLGAALRLDRDRVRFARLQSVLSPNLAQDLHSEGMSQARQSHRTRQSPPNIPVRMHEHPITGRQKVGVAQRRL
jgi:hypothetical protein